MNLPEHCVSQSFLLRFWYERSDTAAGHWRGTVRRLRHEDDPVPVGSPDEALGKIKQALDAASSAGMTSSGSSSSVGTWIGRLLDRLRRIYK